MKNSRLLPGVLILIVGLAALGLMFRTTTRDRPRGSVEHSSAQKGHGERPMRDKADLRIDRLPRDIEVSRSEKSLSARDYENASFLLPALPAGARLLSVTNATRDGHKETFVRLDTPLSPTELQVFYTDDLVKDWMILRDSLTEQIGWSGVFLQIGDKENRLGIFGVVREVSGRSGIRTVVSMQLAEGQ